jgi:hypothetical protein
MTAEMGGTIERPTRETRVIGHERRPTVEVIIATDQPPWHATFEFLIDLHTVMRHAWPADMAEVEGYEFVLSKLEEGNKKFKGSLRKRPGNIVVGTYIERFEVHHQARPGGRPFSADALIQAGATLLASVVGAAVMLGADPVSANDLPSGNPINPAVVERIEGYIRDCAGPVEVVFTRSDGSIIKITFN